MHNIIFLLFLLNLSLFGLNTDQKGDLNISSIFPNVAIINQETPLTIIGKGFSDDSKVIISQNIKDNRLISKVDIVWGAVSITVNGDFAYISSYLGGLLIYDIKDINHPKKISEITFENGLVNAMKIEGNIAYLLIMDSLELWDINDPYHPSKISSINIISAAINWEIGNMDFDTFDYSFEDSSISSNDYLLKDIDIYDPFSNTADTLLSSEIIVKDNIVYIADSISGITVVDTSDPSNLKFKSNLETGTNLTSHSLALKDNIIYSVNDGKLNIINAADKESLKKISSLNISETASDIEIKDNIAYIVSTDEGLRVVDISNNSAPRDISSLSLKNAKYITIKNNMAYLSTSDSGLVLIDISNPEKIKRISTIDIGNNNSVFISDNTAFITEEFDGFSILDISDPESTQVFNIGAEELPESFEIKDQIAYVAGSLGSLSAIDISDKKNLTKLSYVLLDEMAKNVKIKDNTAYVVTNSGLSFVDISNPAELTEISEPFQKENIQSIAIEGNYAYVASFDGLNILDISDTSSISKVASIDLPNTPYSSMIINKNTIYLSTLLDKGVYLIDINDPANPEIITHMETSSFIMDLAIEDNTLCAATIDNGLAIIDISNEDDPELLTNLEINSTLNNVTLYDNIVYITDDKNMISFIDINNPRNPILIEQNKIIDAELITDIKLSEDKRDILVSSLTKGLIITSNTMGFNPQSTFIDNNTLKINFSKYTVKDSYNIRIYNDNNSSAKIYDAITLISQDEAVSLTPKDLILRTHDEQDGFITVDMNNTNSLKLNALLKFEDDSVVNLFKSLEPGEYSISSSDKNKAYYFNNKLLIKNRGLVTITINAKGLSDSLTLNIIDSSNGTPFQDNHKDAVIVLGHIDDKGGELSALNPYDPLRYSINKIGNNIYRSLNMFGLSPDNIHYFNPNGEQYLIDEDNDKERDNAVDLTDFSWDDIVDTINGLDSSSSDPLILWMVDHGLNKEIRIGENKKVSSEQIKELLDNFRENTSRPVIAVFDACFSGSIAEAVQGDNRIVISSADTESETYMDQFTGKSFSTYFLKYLKQGSTIKESFDKTNTTYNQILASQGLSINPTFSNNTSLSKKLYKSLNKIVSIDSNYTLSDFKINNGEPDFTDFTGIDSNITLASSSYDIEVKTDLAYPSFAKVFASITPPNPVMDINGSKMLKNELIKLTFDKNDNYFKNTYYFNKEGNYSVNYIILDDDGNIYNSDSTIFIQNQNYATANTNDSVSLDDNTNNTSQTSDIKLSFTSGWNLVSLPTDTSILYDEIPSKLPNASSIWKYSKKWKAYGKGSTQTFLNNAGISKLESVSKGDGFWVYSTANETVEFSGTSYDITTLSTLKNAESGWHLIGSGTDIIPTDIIDSNSNIDTIWTYSNNSWSAYSPDSSTQNLLTEAGVDPLNSIDQGTGFWIYIQ